MNKVWRKTDQFLLPDEKPLQTDGRYDIYPSLKIDDNLIEPGLDTLADLFLKHRYIIIDGYIGVFGLNQVPGAENGSWTILKSWTGMFPIMPGHSN